MTPEAAIDDDDDELPQQLQACSMRRRAQKIHRAPNLIDTTIKLIRSDQVTQWTKFAPKSKSISSNSQFRFTSKTRHLSQISDN